MDDAAALGDIFVTVTGCEDVIVKRHFDKMKDGVLLANAGHFDCEVKVSELGEISERVVEMRHNVEGYVQKDGRILKMCIRDSKNAPRFCMGFFSFKGWWPK